MKAHQFRLLFQACPVCPSFLLSLMGPIVCKVPSFPLLSLLQWQWTSSLPPMHYALFFHSPLPILFPDKLTFHSQLISILCTRAKHIIDFGKMLVFFIAPPPGEVCYSPNNSTTDAWTLYAKCCPKYCGYRVSKTCPSSCLHRAYHMIRNRAIHQRSTQIIIKPKPPRNGMCYESLWWIYLINYINSV